MAGLKDVAAVNRLTPTQAGMLYECLTKEDPTLYFEQFRADIQSAVDVERFRRAWQLVTDRHEALRTMIVYEGLDEPVQVVRRHVEVVVNYIDNTANPAAASVDVVAATNRAAGIALSSAPMFAITLIKTANDAFHLIWDFHHLIADGWSAAIVIDEVLRAYDDALADDAPLQFSDYLKWLQDQNPQTAADYWSDLLTGLEGPSRLALGGVASARSGYVHNRVSTKLSPADTREIESAARSLRVTTNTLLQGACALTLGAYSNETDVVFGVTTSGRNSAVSGLDQAVGMFLKTLPFRTEVNEPVPVSKWLRGIQEQQVAADEHAHVTLAETLAHAGIGVNATPFDLVWIYENFPRSNDNHSLQLTAVDVFEQTNYPITVMAGVMDGSLELVALYNSEILSPGQAQGFLSHLTNAARALAAHPEEPVTAVSVLSPVETGELVNQAAGPSKQFPGTSLHQRFEEVATLRPDKTALIEGSDRLTFCELATASDCLAADLTGRGVKPGDAVGVEMVRSRHSVVAMLAIMKAGAAYVALPPDHPESRRRAICQEANTVVVLTEADVPVQPDLNRSAAGSPPAPTIAGLSPALITFTSGSSGIPKGVAVHHQGVMNRLQWQWDSFGADDREVMAHKTSLMFVDHLWELWGGLLAGRTVVVVCDQATQSLETLVGELASNHVTQVSVVPSLLEALSEHTNLGKELPSLKLWTVSGEPLTPEVVQQFYRSAPDATLVNLYGMSEASQDCTAHVVGRTETSVAIGQPISNMATHVVGPNMHLAPPGVIGELCVAGVGVSPGYLNRPDLTAEKFTPNPFGTGVLYKTGDLAWRREDGNIELVGRADRQVKIRGVRIEPGEVEAALMAQPNVKRASVLAVDGRLVAFVTGAAADGQDLRHAVAEVLPGPMVPNSVHVLSKLPQTVSGKLDRQALVGLARSAPSNSDHSSEVPTPSVDVESDVAQMMALWRDLLGVPVGPDDDFFASGGHSLMGLKLFSRIKRETGKALPLSALVEFSTPRSLAKLAAAPETIPSWTHLVPMGSTAQRKIFCVHGAGGNVLNFTDLAKRLNPEFQLVGIKAAGAEGSGPRAASIDELCNSYITEIVRYQPRDPLILAGFSNGGLVAYEIAARLRKMGRTIEAVLLFDTFHPSVVAEPYGKQRHLRDFRSGPIRFVRSKLQDRVERLKISLATRWSPAQELWSGEATEWTMIRSMIELWADYEPNKLDCRVVLFSAADTHETLLHAGPARQWPSDMARVVIIPGDHKNHVEGPNADTLAVSIKEQLSIKAELAG